MFNQASSIKSLRHRLHDGIRKQQVQTKFKVLRQQLKRSYQNIQHQQFTKLISQIDEDNFAKNRKLLRYYSYDQSNSFLLVSFSGLIYEFLIENPYDFDIIELTKTICSFQEVDIPITEQFLGTLIKLLCFESQNPKINQQTVSQIRQIHNFNQPFNKNYFSNSALEIITLLLGYHKYQQILRQMLLYADFAEILQKFTNQQISYVNKVRILSNIQDSNDKNRKNKQQLFSVSERIKMVCEIYCLMIKSMPPVQQKFFAFFVSQLSQIIGNFPCLDHFIADTFAQINLCFAPDFFMCKYIMESLQIFLLSNFHNFGKEMLSLLKFCCRSKYFISEKSFHKLLQTAREHHDDRIKKEALFCLQMFLKSPEEDHHTEQKRLKQSQAFYQKVLEFLSEDWFYKPIIGILAKDPQMQGQTLDVFYALLKGFMKSQDLIQRKGLLFYEKLVTDPVLIQVLDECLISFQKTATDFGLNIVYDLLVLESLLNIQSFQMSFKQKTFASLAKPIANIANNNLPLKENRSKEMENLAEDILSIIDPTNPRKMDIQF